MSSSDVSSENFLIENLDKVTILVSLLEICIILFKICIFPSYLYQSQYVMILRILLLLFFCLIIFFLGVYFFVEKLLMMNSKNVIILLSVLCGICCVVFFLYQLIEPNITSVSSPKKNQTIVYSVPYKFKVNNLNDTTRIKIEVSSGINNVECIIKKQIMTNNTGEFSGEIKDESNIIKNAKSLNVKIMLYNENEIFDCISEKVIRN